MLSTEAILAIISLFVALPPSILVIQNLLIERRHGRDATGPVQLPRPNLVPAQNNLQHAPALIDDTNRQHWTTALTLHQLAHRWTHLTLTLETRREEELQEDGYAAHAV
ncbi:MAG: hypothetical protein M1834_009686 [Cirrosporium novae-zelandiae]|nr:MAG: hypothetical protein M1834_009686 [Cirrosporium novae-zelandiae]